MTKVKCLKNVWDSANGKSLKPKDIFTIADKDKVDLLVDKMVVEIVTEVIKPKKESDKV